LVELQKFILSDSAPYTKVGGLLIYATCSVWREENEGIADWFAVKFPHFSREHQLTTWPSFETEDPLAYHDGGFVSVFRRQS